MSGRVAFQSLLILWVYHQVNHRVPYRRRLFLIKPSQKNRSIHRRNWFCQPLQSASRTKLMRCLHRGGFNRAESSSTGNFIFIQFAWRFRGQNQSWWKRLPAQTKALSEVIISCMLWLIWNMQHRKKEKKKFTVKLAKLSQQKCFLLAQRECRGPAHRESLK